MNVKMPVSDIQNLCETTHREEKKITEDYDCRFDCRSCPFPGAKCFPSKYLKPER